jgi:hypothetical protein
MQSISVLLPHDGRPKNWAPIHILTSRERRPALPDNFDGIVEFQTVFFVDSGAATHCKTATAGPGL